MSEQPGESGLRSAAFVGRRIDVPPPSFSTLGTCVAAIAVAAAAWWFHAYFVIAIGALLVLALRITS